VLLGAISRFLLDPLAKYPGPFIARFTDAYGGYHAAKKQLHLATHVGHLKYGSVYRLGPKRLVFNTVNAVRDIYLHPNVSKAGIYRHTQFNVQTNIFGTLDKTAHRQKRKLYGRILSDRSIRTFEPTMLKEIDAFLQQLSNSELKAINLSPLCERLTADVAGQLAFGQPLDTQTSELNRVFPRAMASMNALVSLFMAWPNMSLVWPLLRQLVKKSGRAFQTSIQRIIKARLALPKDAKHDFYSMAPTDVGDGDAALTKSELWAEAIFIIPAGGTTVSTALSSVFFYLANNEHAYARLAKEIRETFNEENEIQTGPMLYGCQYLRAVIDEAMRMSPPFLGTFWRETTPSQQEWIVDGHVIPRGTIVGVSPYAIMHNEAYFPEPYEFRPERWLVPDNGHTGEEEARKNMQRAFVPFCLGETGCLGKTMAYQETSLTIARTLWRFDFSLAPGEEGKLGQGRPGRGDGREKVGEYQLLDISTADHDGPNLVFKDRGSGLD
jgi:cytochrome P450